MKHVTPAEINAKLVPGSHGGEGGRLAELLEISPNDVLDLSASLNPFAPDVVNLASSRLDELRRYPDPAAATALLASTMGVAPERLLLTNGGAEAIALVASDMGVGRVDEPEFSLYRRHLALATDVSVTDSSRNVDLRNDDAPRWRSNPNNPTGLLADATEQSGVWDEAFYPLATGNWTRGDSEAVVVGSLTKLYACPGLRLGYVLAEDEDLIARLAIRQPAWSVNSLGLGVLPDLIEATDLSRWAISLAGLRDDLATLLATYGFKPSASDASWLLVPKAGDLRASLATKGVLVRDCNSFGLTDTIRIAVPSASGLDQLQEALSTL